MFSDELIQTLKRDGFELKPVLKKAEKGRSTENTGEFLINRYPIMATLAYCIAKRAGYSEKFSKSLAVAVATNYAILKRVGGFHSHKSYKEKQDRAEWIYFDSPESLEKYDVINFCGCSLIIDPKQELVLALAYVRGKQSPFYPDKFDREKEKIEAIRPNAFKILCDEINSKLDKITEDFANAPFGKGYFNFWKKYRDYWRSREFWLDKV